MITFVEIKNEWEVLHYIQDSKLSLEQYINDNYTQVYDDEFNFLGWEKGNNYA